MATMDVKTLMVPVGIVRLLELLLTCITFGLVASFGHSTYSFWTWCMFVWCSCFCVTFLILVLELTGLSSKLPISWGDFTRAYAMLATLLVLSASIIFPVIFTSSVCDKCIAASVTSCIAFILYAVEVGLTRAKPGESSGFLSTVPGLLKVLEAFVACIIFTCLGGIGYKHLPGLQWCVAVYSICFIFAINVIALTICRLHSLLPAPFDKVLCVCNVMAVLMYMSAVVIWPFYALRNSPRPKICSLLPHCPWDDLVTIAVMTGVNLVAYIIDTVYSFRLAFSASST
ncbi:myeloid-associated differentiation marker homolog [Cheilinus undulatus]|uniref:myeloid-associated differentiation marker homolog n=1 Tax=Cheilinus undulatus TaxID=241271 RepID=UPI001BD32F8F|nr:myeloid-associated differentiation marker homolog [Cheilinus undulatus]